MRRVIIIGGDHHNTLSVIRAFGKKNILVSILIHTNIKEKKNLMVYSSKYIKDNLFVVDNNSECIYDWLLLNKNNDKNNDKSIIIPCSDLAAYVIDKNFDELNNGYYITGFKNNSGEVCRMMNKYEQSKWALSNNILIPKTWLLLKENMLNIPENIIYPCIVKPSESFCGTKEDIKICNNKKELLHILGLYKKKYDEILIQQFIKKDYEILAMGLICDDEIFGGIERKIRETIPGGGGSTSLGQFIDNQEIINRINKIIKQLQTDGYRGFYDIEFFECGSDIYLNEINYRHSGSGFALIDNGINCPYIYYLDCIGNSNFDNLKLKHPHGYFFCDLGEMHLLLKYHTINIFQFIGDFFKSYTHSIFHISDMKVIIIQLYKKLKKQW